MIAVFNMIHNIYIYIYNCSLLWAKTSVEKENQKMVPICWDGVPWNSSLVGRSISHTTKPVNIKKTGVVIQRSVERGFKNIHMLLLLPSLRTTIAVPKSVNGSVKSTYLLLFDVIVISPTTPSYFYFKIKI